MTPRFWSYALNFRIIQPKKNDLYQLAEACNIYGFAAPDKIIGNDAGHFAGQALHLHLRYKNKIV